MKRRVEVLRWVVSVALIALACSGCASSSVEPKEAWETLPPEEYAFDVVWECSLEAAEGEGLEIESSSHDGEIKGEFTSAFRTTKNDPISKIVRAHRLRVRVRAEEQGVAVDLAAGQFERKEGEGEWLYIGPDTGLRDRIKDGLRRALEDRYR